MALPQCYYLLHSGSRWLPTVLGAVYDKIVLNLALGFDSFLVMRHGHGESSAAAEEAKASEASASQRLGCYFCNDVSVPGDSMTDRTLDQQCTVTRPGLAPMAGAIGVEMLVSLLHHPRVSTGCMLHHMAVALLLRVGTGQQGTGRRSTTAAEQNIH